MLTKDFKGRSAKDRLASEAQALATRGLREFPLIHHCEIGPFVPATPAGTGTAARGR